MNRNLAVWEFIRRSLQENIPVMLLYVLESTGSSPGRPGFCMVVNALGEMQGSIGGGIMEHKFVELAKDKLMQPQQEPTIYKQVHNKKAIKHQSGMICSGEQSNLMYVVKSEDLNVVDAIIQCLENNKVGKLTISNNGIDFIEEIPKENFVFSFHDQDDQDWLYEEKIGYKNHLYIIGAGHCALAFSELMSKMDFCIHLYDDRENLNTFLQNSFVHEKLVLKDYNQLSNLIPSGKNNYIVVMTIGYRTDDIAVRTLMNKDFKFFGILGSKKKIEKMFTTYREEGMDECFLAKIHAPVGLPVNSQTPEEIAISIAAEIIKVKNGG